MANGNETALDVAKGQFKEGSLSGENRAKLLELTKKNISEAGGDREAGLAATREQLAVTEAPQIAEEAVNPVDTIEATPPSEITPEIIPVEPTEPEIITPPVEEIKPIEEVKVEPTEKEKLEVTKLEENRVRTKATETLNRFNEMLESGVSTTELAQFAVKQPGLKTELNTALKRHFGNKSNLNYVQQFETATDAELTDAIDNKDIVIGSRQYNLLPEETRRRVDRLNTLSSSTKKTDFTKDNENVLSLSGITEELSQFFSFDLRSKIEEAKNDPALKQTRGELEGLQNSIGDVDASIESMEDDLKKEFPNLPKSALNALFARRSKDLIRSKNSLVGQYNSKLASYSDMKQDINTEIEIAKFEDSQNKQLFQVSLNMYETRRKEMKADQLAVFEAQNKILAEQRTMSNAKEMAIFNQELRDNKVSGKWESRQDGMWFLSDDGVATKVVNGGFTKGNDGNTTYTYTDKSNNPIIETYDINGEIIGASTQTNMNQFQTDLLNAPNGSIIPTRLKKTTNKNGGKECAEYINDIFAVQVGARMGDSYASKLKVANEKEGRIGSIVAWQPNPTNKEFAKFGHAGVIVGESDDGKKWHIKSSNLNVDGKISVVAVPKNVIGGYKSTTLFDNKLKKSYTEAQQKFIDTLDIKKFDKNARDTMKGLGLTEEDIYGSRSEGLSTDKKEKLNNVLSALTEVRNTAGLESAVGFGLAKITPGFLKFGEGEFVEGSNAANFALKVDKLVNNILLPNLDLMSGVLSETDIQILKTAGTELSTKQSEKEFKKTLDKLENKYREALGLTHLRTEDVIYTDVDGIRYNKQTLKDEISKQIREFNKTGKEVGGESASPETWNKWLDQTGLKNKLK